MLNLIRSLQLFPAAGICLLGVVVAKLLEFPADRYWLYWFTGGLLVYNLDRWQEDPADRHNVPKRTAGIARFRQLNLLILMAAAVVLLVGPWLQQRLRLGFGVLTGSLFCAGYSRRIPLLKRRLKDLPVLKTFFPPVAITTAFLALPWLEVPGQIITNVPRLALVLAWCAGGLTVNVILCDLRDLAGDARHGVVSLPVALGREETLRLTGALLALIWACSLLLAFAADDWRRATTCGISAAYLTGLVAIAGRRHQLPESFYEIWVDGYLYVTAWGCWAAFALLPR